MLQVALVAAVCFLVGGVNPATLVARMLGIDLRTAGSGNPGAANAGRVLGRKWGALVLALDVLKAYLPTLVVLRTMGMVPALVAGLAVVLGHVFSPFLGGKGGKGVAAALGAMLAIAPWVAAPPQHPRVVGSAHPLRSRDGSVCRPQEGPRAAAVHRLPVGDPRGAAAA